MISPQEIEEIEVLESIVLKRGLSFNEVAGNYAEFLVEVACENYLTSKIDFRERRLACAFLKKRIDFIGDRFVNFEANEALRRLWGLEKRWRKSREGFSALIRCIICCYGTEEQWLKDDVGEDTPLGVYFFFLKKFDPELADYFFLYFRKNLQIDVD
jgi:hypothetical protein